MLIEFDTAAWLIGMAILGIPLFVLRRRGGYYLFFFAVFWVYLLVLVSVTVFPMPVGMDGGFHFESIGQQIGHMVKSNSLNLVPLYFNNCWDLPRACAIGIYENVLMTVPFGFGINFIARFRSRDFFWLAFGLGLLIETIQFALDLILGGAYRSVDINDVLFNGLGVWIGYGSFLVFAWLFMAITQRFGIRQTGLLAFIQDICRGGLAGTSGSSGTSSTKEPNP
jgi:glycopeptide antibiotics resistance protein